MIKDLSNIELITLIIVIVAILLALIFISYNIRPKIDGFSSLLNDIIPLNAIETKHTNNNSNISGNKVNKNNENESNINKNNENESKNPSDAKLIVFEFPNFEGKNWVLGDGDFTGKILNHYGIPLKGIGSCILLPKTQVSFFRHRDLTGLMHDKENLTYSVLNPYSDKPRKVHNFVELGWNSQTQSIRINTI